MSSADAKHNLVFGVDAGFLPHVGVVLASVAAHTPPDRLRVWIATEMADLSTTVAGPPGTAPGLELHWLPIDHRALARAPTTAHISSASYYRLLIPALLPSDVDRYLYLDADLVVEKDLTELFATDLGQTPLAAVIDASHPTRHLLGMRDGSRYFNAGVLLINRPAWLQQRITERALELIDRYSAELAFHDQDILNVLLDGTWLELEPCWNQQTGFWEQTASRLQFDRTMYRRLLHDPAIVHFTGRSKPWQFTNDHPLKHRYFAYRALAGMGTEPPRAKSVAEVLRRGIKLVTPYRQRDLARRIEGWLKERLVSLWK